MSQILLTIRLTYVVGVRQKTTQLCLLQNDSGRRFVVATVGRRIKGGV